MENKKILITKILLFLLINTSAIIFSELDIIYHELFNDNYIFLPQFSINDSEIFKYISCLIIVRLKDLILSIFITLLFLLILNAKVNLILNIFLWHIPCIFTLRVLNYGYYFRIEYLIYILLILYLINLFKIHLNGKYIFISLIYFILLNEFLSIYNYSFLIKSIINSLSIILTFSLSFLISLKIHNKLKENLC